MKKTKKWIAVWLILAMIFALIACSEENDSSSANTAEGKNPNSAAETEPPLTGLEAAQLPEKDYEGETFRILSDGWTGDYSWRQTNYDEMTGDTLVDSIFNRNRKIENLYNVEIETIFAPNGLTTEARVAIQAGDTSYSVLYGQIDSQYTLTQEGLLLNLNETPHIDLTRSWWDQSVPRDLTIFNKLYFACGDICGQHNVRVFCIVFNKELCRDVGLDMPYEAVRNGTWTIDKMSEYVKSLNYDVNGDSVMDFNDRWAYLSQYGNSYMMYYSAGGHITENGSDGIPKLVMDNEKYVNLMLEALKISSDKTTVLMCDDYANSNGWQAVSAWFAAGGSMMRSTCFEPVVRDLRSMEADFGVIPYPKLSETQTQYYSLPEIDVFMFSIPLIANADRSGLILEALAAESSVTVKPAFYDVCLNGKVVRDEESRDMLDIIFNNKIFDVGYILNLGGFRDIIVNLEKNSDTNLMSAYASIKESSQKTLDTFVANIKALDN